MKVEAILATIDEVQANLKHEHEELAQMNRRVAILHAQTRRSFIKLDRMRALLEKNGAVQAEQKIGGAA